MDKPNINYPQYKHSEQIEKDESYIRPILIHPFPVNNADFKF